MKKVKKIFSMILMISTFITLTACGNVSSEEEVAGEGKLVKIASVVPANSPASKSIKEVFIPYIEEELPGEYNIHMYDSSVLGNESASYAYTKTGIVEFSLLGSSMWSESPKMTATDFPFMFRDVGHARRAYQGELGDFISESINSSNPVTLMSFFPNGVRAFSSNKPLEKVEDFEGQRMRMPNNPIHVLLAESLGANVIIMDLGEVFTSLEQGVVDGQDNPLSTLRNEGWYEVQEYVYQTDHIIASLHLFGSDKFLNNIPAEHRKIFEEATLLASDYAWDLYIEQIDEDKQFLKEQGIKFTDMTEEEHEKIIEKIQPVYDHLESEYEWAPEVREMVEDIE